MTLTYRHGWFPVHKSLSDTSIQTRSPLIAHKAGVCTRKPTPWFNSIAEQFCELKRERRQARDDGLNLSSPSTNRYTKSIKLKVTNPVDKAKQAYISAMIQSSTTCKQLFQNVNTILGKSSSSPLPSTFDSDDLPNVFSDYFTKK